ncbi:MAG: KamA family radical SAM protein [Magnetococcales bacterium]|nr:KamA family radical SAM protein [Magnetococcales bacterium]
MKNKNSSEEYHSHQQSPIDFVKKNLSPSLHSDKIVRLDQWDQRAARLFPLLLTDSFAARIDWSKTDDPLLKQILPTREELELVPGFTQDPLQETQYRVAPGVVKKYQNRVIFQLTGACPIHCRYCFRRHNKTETFPKTLSEWQSGLDVVRSDPSIREVIFSGGDPLMVSANRVLEISRQLADIGHVQRLRIHSRVPVADPNRITTTLVDGLKAIPLVLSMVIHMNHPAEMDAGVTEALAKLVDAGIPLYNQSVLLKGINDDAQTLIQLSEVLIGARVTPYYLHLLDPVAGAAHFQVEEKTGRSLIKEIRDHLPGYAVPLLVRDRPGTPSKLPI